ncbi:MAG: hypothetical protein ACREAA_06520 [Candidatus Polarisedimenticolia bacterium]
MSRRLPAGPGAAILVAVAGFALITAVMSIHGFMPYDHPSYVHYDHMAYLAMAREGPGVSGQASTPPFCWRLLTPWLAGLMPCQAPLAFFLINAAALLGTSLALYAYARQAGLSRGWSLFAQAGHFSCFWAAGYLVWGYIMVDAVSLLVGVLGMLVIERESWSLPRRLAVLVPLLIVGAANKESTLAVAAAVAVYGWTRTQGGVGRRLWPGLVTVLPVIATLALIRLWIAADPSQVTDFPQPYSPVKIVLEMIRVRLSSLPSWMMDALVDPWGPLILVPLLSPVVGTIAWFRRHPHRLMFVMAAFGQTLIGTSVGRLVILCMPVLVLLSTERIRDRLSEVPRRGWTITFLFACQLIFQYLRRTTLGLGVPPYSPLPIVRLAYLIRAASFAAFAAAWLLAIRRSGARPAVDRAA